MLARTPGPTGTNYYSISVMCAQEGTETTTRWSARLHSSPANTAARCERQSIFKMVVCFRHLSAHCVLCVVCVYSSASGPVPSRDREVFGSTYLKTYLGGCETSSSRQMLRHDMTFRRQPSGGDHMPDGWIGDGMPEHNPDSQYLGSLI